jgi:L-ascorbate metabolism protein UlaG (beta-lactamase superfamily)
VVGEAQVIRAAAGRFDTPLGEVVGIASEHDDAAGTERGANTIYRFTVGGFEACHLGDLGQRELRDPQRAAMGSPDLLFVPVGGGPTIGPSEAATIVRDLGPRIVVPMHFRTPALTSWGLSSHSSTSWTRTWTSSGSTSRSSTPPPDPPAPRPRRS